MTFILLVYYYVLPCVKGVWWRQVKVTVVVRDTLLQPINKLVVILMFVNIWYCFQTLRN